LNFLLSVGLDLLEARVTLLITELLRRHYNCLDLFALEFLSSLIIRPTAQIAKVVSQSLPPRLLLLLFFLLDGLGLINLNALALVIWQVNLNHLFFILDFVISELVHCGADVLRCLLLLVKVILICYCYLAL